MSRVIASMSPGRRTGVAWMVGSLAVAAATGLALGSGHRAAFAPAALLVGLATMIVILRATVPALGLWLLVGAVVPGAPVSLFRGLYLAPGVAIAVGGLVSYAATRSRRATPVDLLPAAFIAISVISYRYGLLVDLPPTAPTSILRDILVVHGLGILAYYVIVFAPLGRDAVEVLIAWLMRTSVISSCLALADYLLNFRLFPDTDGWSQLHPRRAIGALVNPSVLGTVTGIGLVCAIGVLAFRGSARHRRLAAVTAALGAPSLFFTLSRGPIIAGVATCFAMLLFARRSRWGTVFAAIAIALALFANWSSLSDSQVYRNRVQDQSNVDFRAEMTAVSLRAIAVHPIFGWGYGTFDTVKDRPDVQGSAGITPGTAGNTSHNTLLTIGVELGLVGLVVVVAPFVAVGLLALRLLLARRSRDAARRASIISLLFALAVWFLNAIDIDFRFFPYAVALGWVLLGLLRLATREDEPSASR